MHEPILRFYWGKFHMGLACHSFWHIQVDSYSYTHMRHHYFGFGCIFNILWHARLIMP